MYIISHYGYRHSSVIKDKPKCEMIEFLDSFFSRERLVFASVARRNNVITSIKKESNSSHCNQAFNQTVAKNDKKVAAITLAKQPKLVKLPQKGSTIT